MYNLYSFIFKGLLTEESLDKAGREKKITNAMYLEKDIGKRLPFELIDEELIAISIKMATVFCILNGFENSVRKFIVKTLQEKFKEDWWENGVGDKIRKRAEDRKEKEQKIKWHTQRGDDLINYIDFSHLNLIIINNWELFEPHLQVQEWAQSILGSLEKSRNVIMHSGELEKEDIERVGTLIRDWVKQVGT